MSDDVFAKLVKYKRTVLVFSHTSYADFYILVLYILAYPGKLSHVRTLIKPQPFEYLGWLLRWLGAIPATRVDDKEGGAVNRIVRELKESDRCVFLISPKGTILKREWRSGYYHIAQELDAPIRVAGLDYEKQCVVMSDEICDLASESVVKEFLLKELQQIVPLFPEEEVVEIRPHRFRRLVNKKRLLTITIIIIGLGFSLRSFL